MVKFNKCKLNSTILDQWVSTEVNVLLIGEKGVGKSHMIIDTFKRNNLKYAYFSGATLDPWIHLLGIPKAKLMADGTEKMEFILPENLDDGVEAIFCDEWNRTNKVVRNALLELQQFKSINGRKFPKLKMVWGAVNPPKEEDDDDSSNYDVDELDPAQLDRFHVVVEMPNEPDIQYFKGKFGDYRGRILVDWWKEQPKDALKILSPRRLEYVGTNFDKGLDIKYMLPVSANVKDLVKRLSVDEKEDYINNLLKNPSKDGIRDLVKDKATFLKYKNKLKSSKLWPYWECVAPEFLADEIQTNENFANFAVYEVLNKNPVYIKVVGDIAKANPQCNIIKIIKILHKENYKPEPLDSLGNFVSSAPNFSLPKGGNSIIDTFTASIQVGAPKTLQYQSAIYNFNTNERKKRIALLMDCWKKTEPFYVINFMLASLVSMQKGTIQADKNFLPVFGAACLLIKQVCTKDEIEGVIIPLLENQKSKGKISSNRMDEFLSYLKNIRVGEESVLPETFLKKVKGIRGVLNISGTGNDDILDLLQLT